MTYGAACQRSSPARWCQLRSPPPWPADWWCAAERTNSARHPHHTYPWSPPPLKEHITTQPSSTRVQKIVFFSFGHFDASRTVDSLDSKDHTEPGAQTLQQEKVENTKCTLKCVKCRVRPKITDWCQCCNAQLCKQCNLQFDLHFYMYRVVEVTL